MENNAKKIKPFFRMKKEKYLEMNKKFADIYGTMGYSNKPLYDYEEMDENIMDYDGMSEYATKFDIKRSTIIAITKAITESAAYQRTSQKSMMATRSTTIISPENQDEEYEKKFRDSEALIQTRQTHMREVADVAKMISNGLGLNDDFAYLMGLLHDIGHTWNGHSGERMLSTVARLKNCGYIVHNAMGAYILERENIIEMAIKQVKQFNSTVKEDEIKEFMRYVMDGVVSHNGEGTVGKIIPETKTTDDKVAELRKCFTEKGYDKKIMPATLEGAIIRYADIIAYTRSDIMDGFRLRDENGNKILKEFDDDYLSIIGTVLARENNYTKVLTFENKILIESYKLQEEIEELEEAIKQKENNPEARKRLEERKKEREMIQAKYEKFCEYKIEYAKEYISRIKDKSKVKEEVTQMMQNAFIKDLIETSKNKPYITMSPLMRRTFFALRDLNARRIVPYTRRAFEANKLPIATKALVEDVGEVLKDTGIAYYAIPKEEREKLELKEPDREKNAVIRKEIESNKKTDYDRKIIHYYENLNSEKINEMYLNCIEAIKDVTKHDIRITLGEEQYDGELAETYESEKIIPIKKKINESGKRIDEITEKDKEMLYNKIVEERMKDIETVFADKMAIDYIGGMTDKTIISLLIEKNLISKREFTEGYGRPVPGTQERDKGVEKLQNAFKGFEKMILPDEEEEISL